MSKEITPEFLDQYKQLKKMVAELTEEECKMRQTICDSLLEGKTPGAHKSVHGYYQVTATRKITHSLDKSIVDAYTRGEFTEEQEALLNLDIKLRLKNYKTAASADKDAIDEYLTVKEAMPTLTVEEI